MPCASSTIYRGGERPTEGQRPATSQLSHSGPGPESRSPVWCPWCASVPVLSTQAPRGSQDRCAETLPHLSGVPTWYHPVPNALSIPDHLLGATARGLEGAGHGPPTKTVVREGVTTSYTPGPGGLPRDWITPLPAPGPWDKSLLRSPQDLTVSQRTAVSLSFELSYT